MNETETLFAKVGPDGASQEVDWFSSDDDIVVVNNGLLTPVTIGSATISVKPKNSSKIATCNVEIVAQPEEIDVTLNQATR
ncbi:MAG: Ig-like domain-containing protein [Mycoplasmoidaceae bacterium]|nr:Ig-like domain-containing protein [Mycoplasmoidaceae bacterium]